MSLSCSSESSKKQVFRNVFSSKNVLTCFKSSIFFFSSFVSEVLFQVSIFPNHFCLSILLSFQRKLRRGHESQLALLRVFLQKLQTTLWSQKSQAIACDSEKMYFFRFTDWHWGIFAQVSIPNHSTLLRFSAFKTFHCFESFPNSFEYQRTCNKNINTIEKGL